MPVRKNGFNFIYVCSLYGVISTFLITAQFFISCAAVYLAFKLVRRPFWLDERLILNTVAYDSIGFAVLTSTNTLLQYYLASLMRHNTRPAAGENNNLRSPLFGVLILSAAVSSAFFIRLAERSSYTAYSFACLPLIFSYLLGGVLGLLQKDAENPFHGSKINIFTLQ
jgi:hypothetical protein